MFPGVGLMFQIVSPCDHAPCVGASDPTSNILFLNLSAPDTSSDASPLMLLTPTPSLPCMFTVLSVPPLFPITTSPFALTVILSVLSV